MSYRDILRIHIASYSSYILRTYRIYYYYYYYYYTEQTAQLMMLRGLNPNDTQLIKLYKH